MKYTLLIRVFVLFLATTICLTSCGFRLRGEQGSPKWLKKGIAIDVTNGISAWKSLLHPRLEAAQIPVYDNVKRAPYVLIIQKETIHPKD